jgi:hypothetical protein
VTYPPKVFVSRLVNSLKGFSARLIRKKHYPSILKKLWGTSLWSPSYFPGSCGGASISIIRQYIEQQNTPLQDSSAVRSLYLRPKKRGFTEHSDKPAKLARSLPGCVARFGRNGKRFFDEHWAAFQIPPARLRHDQAQTTRRENRSERISRHHHRMWPDKPPDGQTTCSRYGSSFIR